MLRKAMGKKQTPGGTKREQRTKHPNEETCEHSYWVEAEEPRKPSAKRYSPKPRSAHSRPEPDGSGDQSGSADLSTSSTSSDSGSHSSSRDRHDHSHSYPDHSATYCDHSSGSLSDASHSDGSSDDQSCTCHKEHPHCDDHAKNDLLKAIAIEELALAHIINSEAEKVQAVTKTPMTPFTPDELIALQQSVAKVLELVVAKEAVLLKKLRLILAECARPCPKCRKDHQPKHFGRQ